MQMRTELPQITEAQRQAILHAPRTADAHRALLASLPAMNAVQVGGTPSATALPADFTVVAWNLERCLFPGASAEHLEGVAPDVVLLSEMDHGMARTKQRHTTADMAAALGMTYAYGVEFFEIGLGGETERAYCEDDFNARGWHGNAVLSKVPFGRATMFRLDDHGHWFSPDHGADPDQPRIGGRNAIAAVLPTVQGAVCVISTHLESNAGADHRAAQFRRLMDAAEAFAPDMPILIGGDLNTGNNSPPDYHWRAETLFADAEARDFDWSFTADGMTTRPSLITPHPKRQMKLDWICGRGLAPEASGVIPSVRADGTPLSDHDAVYARVTL
jgi:endonuclease/exonuclease/phosphatase family metal-dependent hydrolase